MNSMSQEHYQNRVITHLEKEHSHRFRTMCHKNANLAHENQTLMDYYDREKRKSMHTIELSQDELKHKMVQFSQERYVNGLLNHLTDLVFQGNDSDTKIPTDESNISKDSELDDGAKGEPRYLRMEANPFHKSEMSLGSDLITSYSNLTTSTDADPQEQNSSSLLQKDPVRILEQSASTLADNEDSNQEKRSKKRIRGRDQSGITKSGRGTPTHDEMKKVVERLSDSYDVTKLRILTQVMIKTLQHNDRFRYEDKMKLVYNLSRYFNNEKESKSQEDVRRSPSRPQIKGDNTFLFLKADRQKEIRDNAELAAKSLKPIAGKHKNRSRTSVPNLPDVHRLSSSITAAEPKETRRHSLHPDWRQTQPQHSHLNPSSSTNLDKPEPQPPILSGGDLDDMMKIYLRLGHGALLKLPRNYNRALVREKQKSWLRRDLKCKEVPEINGVKDLRVVMKNCRYLRLPKDMIDHLELLV